MASFRALEQNPVYWSATGVPLAGGSLNFYDTNTTTPRNVYGDKALSVNNGSTIALDSSGRANTDIWLNGAYRVIHKDSGGATVDTRENVELPGSGGLTIPTLSGPKYLYNDGTSMSWVTLIAVPDATGSSGKQLGTDGTTVFWETKTASNVMNYQVVTAATTTTIDLSLGGAILLNQAVDITTLTLTNPPSTTKAYIVTITRVKDATGTARVISNLGALATWPGGVPTLTQTTGAIDEFSIKFEPSVTKGRGTVALNLS
jgi:hypothetical protein